MAIGTNIAVGRQARLNINSKTLCFAKAVPKSTREIVTNQDNVMCGDVDININRAQKGRTIVGWELTFDLTWPIAEVVFPLLGVSGSGPWTLGATDTLPSFPVDIDLVGKIHDITDAVVSGWSIRGTKGSRPIQMQLDIIGVSEAAGTFAEDKVNFGAEFAFTHSSMKIEDDAAANLARQFDRFVLAVNNNVVSEFNNSITLTDAVIGGRTVQFATSVPYVTAHDDLYFHHRDANDGLAAEIELDNGTKKLTFAMPSCMAVTKPGSALGRSQQIRTPVTMLAFRDDDGDRVPPLTITAAAS